MDKQQINNEGPVQGQNVANTQNITQYFNAIQDKATSSAKLERLWTIPFSRNPLFLGQEDLLTCLHSRLKQGTTMALTQTQAISGLGGIGKTQIAIEYAYRYRHSYPFVFWVRAEHRETLMSDLVSLASQLLLAGQHETDQMKVVMAVKQWLATHQGWLLIFDNADDVSLLTPFLPGQHTGAIVLTTRATQTQPIAEPLLVEQMNERIGAEFLLRRAHLLRTDQAFEQVTLENQQAARQLCQLVGGLPLALDQAGAYIDETQCSVQDYMNFYRRDQQARTKLLQRRGKVIAGHPEPIATTWALAFAKVEQASTAAADLLRACAFLAPDLIPEELLQKGACHWGASLTKVASDAFQWNETIGELLKYALVRWSREQRALSIHRLVQTVIQDAINKQRQRQWVECTVRAVNAVFPDVQFEEWPMCERCLPHALVCADLVEQENLMLLEAADLLNNIGCYLDDRARYSEAEPLFVCALVIREKKLGASHPHTATSLHDLALLYKDQGKYSEAEPLFVCALVIREKKLGASHPHTATGLHSLAGLYRSQGRYSEAEPLYVRALTIREKQLGASNLDTATSLHNLALLYKDQGKHNEAEPLYVRALTIREKKLGASHPDTATSLHNLAGLYQSQGKYSEAETLYVRAMAIYEEQLGASHPHTAASLHNLAGLYQSQGRYSEAETLYVRALTIREKQLGVTHPHTVTSLHNLAELHRAQGRYEQAEPLRRRALAIREQSPSSQHPNMQTVRQNYAALLSKQRHNTVERIIRHVAKALEITL